MFVTRYWKSQLKPIGNCSPETLRRRLSLLSGIWAMANEEEILDAYQANYWYHSSKKIKINRDLNAERMGMEYPVRPFEYYTAVPPGSDLPRNLVSRVSDWGDCRVT